MKFECHFKCSWSKYHVKIDQNRTLIPVQFLKILNNRAVIKRCFMWSGILSSDTTVVTVKFWHFSIILWCNGLNACDSSVSMSLIHCGGWNDSWRFIYLGSLKWASHMQGPLHQKTNEKYEHYDRSSEEFKARQKWCYWTIWSKNILTRRRSHVRWGNK